MNFRQHLNSTKIQLLFIIVVTTVAYLNTLPNQFVWDDKTFAAWPLTKDFRFLPELLKGSLPFPHEGDFRPLKGIILLLDYKFFGLSPFWYHVQAIAIHLSATLLVYFITKKILASMHQSPFIAHYSLLIPCLTALLFGLHPIHTEAITFITASTDIIGVSFFLGAFYFYLAAYERHRGRAKRITGSIFLAFLAFVSYEITLVLPVIVILFDFLIVRINKKEFLRRVKTYGLYFADIALYFLVRFVILDVSPKSSLPEENPLLIAITMVKAFGEYVKVALFPLNLTVNHLIPENISSLFYVDYDQKAFLSQKITDPETISAAVLIFSILAIGLFLYKRMPLVTFCIFWFFIALAPVSNIIPLNNFMSERYLYLASFGICFLLAYFFAIWHFSLKDTKLGKFIVILLFVAVSAGFFVKTILRNFEWQNSKTLWIGEVSLSQTSVLANHNLGNVYLSEGNLEKAIPHYETAYFNNSQKNLDVIIHLGFAYQRQGRARDAIEKFKIAVSEYPQNFLARSHLANAFRQAKDYKSSEEEYKKSIAIEPNFYDSRIGLGLVYAFQKKDQAAVEEFKTASTLRPDLLAAWQNLGAAYIRMKEYNLAKGALEKAVKIDPGSEQIKTMLLTAERLRNVQKIIEGNN